MPQQKIEGHFLFDFFIIYRKVRVLVFVDMNYEKGVGAPMNLEIIRPDPLGVLASTKPFVESARHVFLNEENIRASAHRMMRRAKMRGTVYATEPAPGENLRDALQKIFLQDVLNFSFWPDQGEPKWSIEWPEGHETNGGWFTLAASFDRALAEGMPLLDAHYLASLSIDDVMHIFRGVDGSRIPNMLNRYFFLRKAGEMLCEYYDGAFINLLEEVQFNAPALAGKLFDIFPAFADAAEYGDAVVRFLKKAQICAYDCHLLSRKFPECKMTDVDLLTAFADYRLPQVLREDGCIQYDSVLAQKIDSHTLIDRGSREEIEIRAATIWSIELKRRHIPQKSSAEIDVGDWERGQEIRNTARPHPRIRTVFY